MTRLSILSLGPLQITLGDSPAAGFDSDKARALLAYLAIEADRPHPRESLAGLFWPEYPEERARQSLSQALSNVRQIIGDRDSRQPTPFLDVTRQALRFNRASDYWLDVERFTVLPNLRAKISDPHQTMRRLEEAVAVYRGAFLEGLSFGDSPAFEEWVLIQREHMHRMMQEALTQLVAGYTQQGAFDRALDYAWRQLDLDPWHEEAHRQVMRLLAQTGQRAAALAHYATCCTILRKDLDVDPEAETVELYEAVKRGALGVRDKRSLAFQQPGSPTSKHNLPAQLMPMIGREAELTTLAARLADPACRLLTLVGPGGIGKTRIALETAAAVVTNFADGVFFVSLMPLHSPIAIVGAVARSLGFVFADRGSPEAQQLQSYLKDKAVLLVLDNVEHLLREPLREDGVSGSEDVEVETTPTLVGLIAGLLEAAPDLKIMITSRVALNALGEYLFPIRELDYPDAATASLAEVRNLAAVRLFVQGAYQRRPDFALTDANVQAVSAICRHVQGVPLAILLCTSWVNTMSVADIAAQLIREPSQTSGAGQDLLETDWQNVPARQRSMRAVFEHSWRLLTEREQRIFQALSVFRGGFTQAAAQAVAGATPKDLRGLVNASLLKRESTGRYTMHRLVQQYAESRLALDPGASHAAHDCHCAYYAAWLQRWPEDTKGPRQNEALAEMDVEISDARAAWAWAVAQGDFARINQALGGLAVYYAHRWLRQQGESACRMALERLEAMGDAEIHASGEGVLALARMLQWYSGFLPQAHALAAAERSLALLESPKLAAQDACRYKAFALTQIGDAKGVFDRAAAIPFYEQTLALFRACGDPAMEALTLLSLGIVNSQIGHFEAARHNLEESLSISRGLKDQRGTAGALGQLSFVVWSLGDFGNSVRLGAEALALERETGDPMQIANGLWGVMQPYVHALGWFDEARPLLEEFQTLSRDLPDLYRAVAQGFMAWAEMYAGHYREAQIAAQLTVDRLRQIKDFPYARSKPHYLAITNCLLGCIASALRQYTEAALLLETGIAAYRSLGWPPDVSTTLCFLSYTLWAQGRTAQARVHLTEALRIGVETGHYFTLIYGLVGMALILISQGDYARAVEIWSGVSVWWPQMKAYRWLWDVAGRHIEAAAATLPEEVVAAAKTCGQERDLHATSAEMLAELEGTDHVV